MWFAVALAAALFLLSALSAPAGAQQPISPPYKPGFPLYLANGRTVLVSQPVAADLGLTPGYKSIVFATRDPARRLYVLKRNNDGSWGVATGFPVTLPAHAASSPAVGDLTGDGIPEIVIGFGSTFDPNSHGGARAYARNGALLWEVQTQDGVEGPNGFRDGVYSTPAIGDVDGDGAPDVAFGSFDFNVYLVNGATGAIKPGWPRFMRDTIFSSPALHDIDGDSRLDIIIGVDAHQEGSPYNTPDGGCLHVLRYDAQEVAGFPQCVDQVIGSAPVVGDIDNDGQPEIVHGTGAFWGENGVPGNPTHAVYAWNCDGTPVSGWPVAVDGQVSSSPALADLDGDGDLEVVVTDDNTGPSGTFHVYAFRGNGTRIFQARPRGFFGETLSASHPIVADVLGDTGLEILVPQNGEVTVFSATGTQLTEDGTRVNTPNQRISFTTETSLGNVLVTDLETDGAGARIEVIAISASPFPDATNTAVHVWNPVNRTSTPPWGMFRRDPLRTGVAPGTGSCGGGAACQVSNQPRNFFTVTPCRLVDTRNAAGPRGGPALASGALRDFTLTGACGIPATARALSLNITVVQPTGAGFIRFSPDCQPPLTSAINFSAGQTRANNAILPLSDQGILTANAVLTGNSGTVHVLIDVNGYFQ